MPDPEDVADLADQLRTPSWRTDAYTVEDLERVADSLTGMASTWRRRGLGGRRRSAPLI
ncbi:hypothetical protein [Nonomuraea endophytica]|uniref:hypothetical protein n=1 Tax=Nonomuraea endophytica TaxID=714136 RepID=UPI0037C86772